MQPGAMDVLVACETVWRFHLYLKEEKIHGNEESRSKETGREEVGRRPSQEDYRHQILNFSIKLNLFFFTIVTFKYSV